MSEYEQQPDAPAFVDTPLKQAFRRAFDAPTVANLDALVIEAQKQAERERDAARAEVADLRAELEDDRPGRVSVHDTLRQREAEVERLRGLLGDVNADFSTLVRERNEARADAMRARNEYDVQIADMAMERNEARQERDEARVDAQRAWDEAVQARVDGARLIVEATEAARTALDQSEAEVARLRALLTECRQVVTDYADPMWNEDGVLVWSLIAPENLLARLDAALRKQP